MSRLGVPGAQTQHISVEQPNSCRIALTGRDALRVIAAGTVVGLAGAAVLGRLLASTLFGVAPLDVATYVSVWGGD